MPPESPRGPSATAPMDQLPADAETAPTELFARLKLAQLSIARLEAERDRLESMVVRLGALAAELDADGLVKV